MYEAGVQNTNHLNMQGERDMILFQEDFYSGFFDVGGIGSRADWFFYQNDDFVGKDPEARLSVLKKRLSINIPRYSLSSTGPDDHIKYLFFVNRVNQETGKPGFPVPDHGELRYEICARFRPQGTENNPFQALPDDYRLSSGAVMAMDFATYTHAGFLLTDRKAYVLYGRTPPWFDVDQPQAFFTYVIPIADLDPRSEHLYAIVYQRDTGAVRWSIDHGPVFQHDGFGSRLGPECERFCVLKDLPGCRDAGELPPVASPQLAFGAGLMTFLDAGIRHDAALVDVSDPSHARGNKVFGQGGELIIGTVRVTARSVNEASGDLLYKNTSDL
jgi:hypothetical protein